VGEEVSLPHRDQEEQQIEVPHQFGRTETCRYPTHSGHIDHVILGKMIKEAGMFYKGRGVIHDYVQAHKWFQIAGANGHTEGNENRDIVEDKMTRDQIAEAQYNIGVMYGKGQGVEQDYVQAHKWFNIVEENGYKVGRETKVLVEKEMTPDQIADAQKLAREWMEKHDQHK